MVSRACVPTSFVQDCSFVRVSEKKAQGPYPDCSSFFLLCRTRLRLVLFVGAKEGSVIWYSSRTNNFDFVILSLFIHIVEKHHPSSTINDPCNEECLLNMGRSIYEDNLNQCGKIPGFASPVMHMLTCQRLLSDLDTTKYIRMFDKDPDKARAEHPGMCQRLLNIYNLRETSLGLSVGEALPL